MGRIFDIGVGLVAGASLAGAGLLHNHSTAAAILLAIGVVGIALVAFDIGRSRGLRARHLSHLDDTGGSWDGLNKLRERRYGDQRGLFLVHSWAPSKTPGQVADVTVHLAQHGPGPLESGRVAAVEYTFGPKFDHHAVTKENGHDGFATTVSLWAPMLCVARVNFSDGSPPLILDRYLTFERVPA
jgi:hypothetical protein